MLKIAGYVLAGGGSRRFGTDKARHIIDGRPLLRHAVDALAERYGYCAVVSHPDRSYDDLAVETIFDDHPDKGPLAGLFAALTHTDADAVAIAPCDVVGLDGSWYATLEAAVQPGRPAAFYADRWRPLVAIYPVDVIDEVERRLDGDELTMWRFLQAHGTPVDAPADFATMYGVNRPEDLA